MKSLIGKRFIFGAIGVVCVSVVTIIREFDGNLYFQLVTAITGLFMVSQTSTDSQNKGG